jgi:capsular polysaccharide biosynthesis protein
MPERLAEVARRVGVVAGEPGTARRIYYSRDDASRRRAHNEADLVRVLRAYDFQIMTIDPTKPWEQVRAGLGADLVAGVHGAALTNLIFMRWGGRVLELRHGHDEVFFEAYRPLAEMLGIEYHKQVCELHSEAVGLEINNVDLVVDLDLLRENLSALTS